MASNEKKAAGSGIASVLEKAPQPNAQSDAADGQGTAKPKAKRRSTAKEPKAATQDKNPLGRPRTVYITQPIWERLIVASSRKGVTVSQTLTELLKRHLPVQQLTLPGPDSAEEQGDDVADEAA